MNTTSNVIAFPVDRIRPTTGDVTDAFIAPIATRAPIPVIDNSGKIAAQEALSESLLRQMARAEEFAAAALLAGDASASAGALARADDLAEDAWCAQIHAGHLALEDGTLEPTMQNWLELTDRERSEIVADHFDWLSSHGGEPSIWYDLVTTHLRAAA